MNDKRYFVVKLPEHGKLTITADGPLEEVPTVLLRDVQKIPYECADPHVEPGRYAIVREQLKYDIARHLAAELLSGGYIKFEEWEGFYGTDIIGTVNVIKEDD